jgi:zinc protease
MIKNTHHKQLNNSNLLFSYCGDLPLPAVLENIREKLTPLKPRPLRPTLITTPTKIYGVQKHISFDREQTQIFIGIPTFPLIDNSNIILKLLTTYLSGQSSELFVDVRDRKGLCYSVQPVHFRALEAGYWGIYMASGHDKVQAAQEAILSLLYRIQKHGLSNREFLRIKKMIKGQEQINIQTNEDYANVYSIPVLHSLGIDWHYKILQDIDRLTYSQFKQGLKRILNQEWNIVTAGKDN